MSFSVPANQAVSFTVYNQAVGNESRLPHEFLRSQAGRIQRAFDHGEPIWMIVAELVMIHSVRPTWKPTKTPKALAARFVHVSA